MHHLINPKGLIMEHFEEGSQHSPIENVLSTQTSLTHHLPLHLLILTHHLLPVHLLKTSPTHNLLMVHLLKTSPIQPFLWFTSSRQVQFNPSYGSPHQDKSDSYGSPHQDKSDSQPSYGSLIKTSPIQPLFFQLSSSSN